MHPFNYGNFEQVKQLIKNKKIGVLKMELSRSTDPDINFLKNKKNLYKIT